MYIQTNMVWSARRGHYSVLSTRSSYMRLALQSKVSSAVLHLVLPWQGDIRRIQVRFWYNVLKAWRHTWKIVDEMLMMSQSFPVTWMVSMCKQEFIHGIVELLYLCTVCCLFLFSQFHNQISPRVLSWTWLFEFTATLNSSTGIVFQTAWKI